MLVPACRSGGFDNARSSTFQNQTCQFVGNGEPVHFSLRENGALMLRVQANQADAGHLSIRLEHCRGVRVRGVIDDHIGGLLDQFDILGCLQQGADPFQQEGIAVNEHTRFGYRGKYAVHHAGTMTEMRRIVTRLGAEKKYKKSQGHP